MGHGNFETTSKSRDSGIDGIIYQDKLRVDRIYTPGKSNSFKINEGIVLFCM